MSNHHNTHDAQFGFRVFYAKPRLHQDWTDEQVHRQVTWTELFFDLFYVVACINLGHLVKEEDVWTGVAHLCLYYLLFWFTWSSHTMFTTRIKMPGLLYDIWQIMYMLGIFSMVVTAKDTSLHHKFSAALTAVKFLQSIIYVVAALNIPRASRFAVVVSTQHLTTGILALISVFTSKQVFYGLMAGIIAVDIFWVQIMLWARRIHLPLHVDHMSERFGLIMIIFLGESIVSLGQQSPGSNGENWLMLLFGVVVVWDLHLIYYHVHPGQHFHAMRINRFRGVAWSMAHSMLGFFFLCLGAGLRLTAEAYATAKGGGGGHRRSILAGGGDSYGTKGGDAYSSGADAKHGYVSSKNLEPEMLDPNVAWLLCLGYGVSLHIFYFIRALHFMDFDPEHWWNASLSEHGLAWVAYAWWTFGFLWPFPIYFTAFAYDDLHGAWVLGILALHGLLFIVVETMFTNMLVKDELLQTSLGQQVHKVQSERSLRRSQLGTPSMLVLGSSSSNDEPVGETASKAVVAQMGDAPAVKAEVTV